MKQPGHAVDSGLWAAGMISIIFTIIIIIIIVVIIIVIIVAIATSSSSSHLAVEPTCTSSAREF